LKKFSREVKQVAYQIVNPLGCLREKGSGSFGWETALTSWVLLALPFAYQKKAGYIIFSNEASCNEFFYDKSGLRVIPDYEQSGQATEELSILTQALSEGEVYTTTFLQGLDDIAIISILKNRYPLSLKFLMSCWAETEAAKNKRWCAECSKCARIYLYLAANGIDPIKETGFKDNLFLAEKERFFNAFGQRAAGTGFDAFGTNRDEQLLGFYLTYLRGNRDPLVNKFISSPIFKETQARFKYLVTKYFTLKPEVLTPPQWKRKIDKIFAESLKQARDEIEKLNENKTS
jgi:hypothetical protein